VEQYRRSCCENAYLVWNNYETYTIKKHVCGGVFSMTFRKICHIILYKSILLWTSHFKFKKWYLEPSLCKGYHFNEKTFLLHSPSKHFRSSPNTRFSINTFTPPSHKPFVFILPSHKLVFVLPSLPFVSKP